jgi:lipoate synthase
MKRYSDYQKDKSKKNLSKEELDKIVYTKYKIIVPSEKDKEDIMNAIEDIHHSNVDSDIITINQLIHEYLEGTNIIVDNELYNKLND